MSEMRMAELARRSGVSVPMIKYYLREELLPPGKRTSVNQAVYNESHIERIHLIRALVTVAGLSYEKVREVVQVIDSNPSAIDAMAVTQDALVGDFEEETTDGPAAKLLAQVIQARHWQCHPGSPAYNAAIKAIATLHDENLTMFIDRLDDYALAADSIGRIDVQAVGDAKHLDAMISSIVLGTVLKGSLLNALVLLAQQHHANAIGWAAENE